MEVGHAHIAILRDVILIQGKTTVEAFLSIDAYDYLVHGFGKILEDRRAAVLQSRAKEQAGNFQVAPHSAWPTQVRS